jgi:hypothetical protein
MREYEVVWNGSHMGENADLLVTRSALKPQTGRQSDAAALAEGVADFLTRVHPERHTAAGLARVFSTSAAAIELALRRLRVDGVVQAFAPEFKGNGMDAPRALEWQATSRSRRA